eukprot:3275571-Rhodomonas_salina.1
MSTCWESDWFCERISPFLRLSSLRSLTLTSRFLREYLTRTWLLHNDSFVSGLISVPPRVRILFFGCYNAHPLCPPTQDGAHHESLPLSMRADVHKRVNPGPILQLSLDDILFTPDNADHGFQLGGEPWSTLPWGPVRTLSVDSTTTLVTSRDRT